MSCTIYKALPLTPKRQAVIRNLIGQMRAAYDRSRAIADAKRRQMRRAVERMRRERPE